MNEPTKTMLSSTLGLDNVEAITVWLHNGALHFAVQMAGPYSDEEMDHLAETMQRRAAVANLPIWSFGWFNDLSQA